MAGQWVMPGGGVPPCLYSGRHAVQLMCHADKKRFVTSEQEIQGPFANPKFLGCWSERGWVRGVDIFKKLAELLSRHGPAYEVALDLVTLE